MEEPLPRIMQNWVRTLLEASTLLQKALPGAESSYGKVDGESLGVMSMILANKTYLYGVAFQAITDHKPSCPLYNSPNRALPTRMACHLSKLRRFDFE